MKLEKKPYMKHQLVETGTLLLIYSLTIVSAFAFQNAANKTLETYVPGYATSIWKRWIYVFILFVIVILLIAFLTSTRVRTGLEDPPKPIQKALKKNQKQIPQWSGLGVPEW